MDQQQPKWTRLPLRTRPHRNPLSTNEDDHPDSPDFFAQQVIEDKLYPSFPNNACVEWADVGCAFGGMLIALAPHFPNTLMLGMEIRSKVVEFAQGKTKALRSGELEHDSKHHFNNVWFTQVNVMKFGDCFFHRGQLKRLFFCHPDPHWKKNNVRRRIITPGLVQRYAHWLAPGGLLYTVSDVPELEQWMIQCLDESPQFERVPDSELKDEQWFLDIVTSSSEDAQRAERKKLDKNYAVHRRVTYDDRKVPPLFKIDFGERQVGLLYFTNITQSRTIFFFFPFSMNTINNIKLLSYFSPIFSNKSHTTT